MHSKYKDLYGKKTHRFCNLRKWKDFNKKCLPYLKCVLHLFCVVHGPNYGRFIGCDRETTIFRKIDYKMS